MNAYRYLTTFDPIWKQNAFEHVTVSSHDCPEFSIIARCYSEYSSGPNLVQLADAAFEISGNPGHYGLKNCLRITGE